ncbi:hypothetical protein BDV32DRAFT_3371 [Aspergillus pseudonomiae]|nr:hypothetical protein BDV32DRAFT_3371 [Aspergillus pseudonomiae]
MSGAKPQITWQHMRSVSLPEEQRLQQHGVRLNSHQQPKPSHHRNCCLRGAPLCGLLLITFFVLFLTNPSP